MSSKTTTYILTIFTKPFLLAQTAIGYDGYTGELQFFLAVLCQFPDITSSLMNEWLTSAEVQFLHACNMTRVHYEEEYILNILEILLDNIFYYDYTSPPI
jgi:hypothetical protein